MSEAAGSVQIILSVNQANYTAAMNEAQRQLDTFAGKTKQAGHATVSSMQASSAAIREMNGDFANNTRAVERFITTIPGVGNVLKAAFPVIGGLAFGAMLVEMGMKVADFIQKVNKMPEAITSGFAALSLSQKTATDSLDVMTDKLNNAHAAFEHKPENAMKLALDEAKESADHFAESIVAANSKVDELLSKNHLSGWAILMNKGGTGVVEDAQKEYTKKQDHNAYLYATAAPGSKEQADAKQAMNDTRNGYLGDRQRDIKTYSGYGSYYDAHIADDEGIIGNLTNEQRNSTSVDANAVAKAQAAIDDAAKKKQEGDKKAAAKAKEAIAAAKTAAEERVQAMETALAALKLQQNMSVKQVFDYWERMKATEQAGNVAYKLILAKEAPLADEGAAAAHAKLVAAARKMKQDSAEDSTTGAGILDRDAAETTKRANKAFAEQNEDARDSNQLFMDGAHNTAREQEAQVIEAAGKSMTRYAAAMKLADIHAAELKATLTGLGADLDIAKNAHAIAVAGGDPDQIRQTNKAQTQAQIAYDNANRQGVIQSQVDQNNKNPVGSSALVGFQDALQDFVNSTKDSAAMMRNLTENTLRSLNDQIVAAMSGQKTDFKNMGAGVFRDVSKMALQKAEGSILGPILDKFGVKHGKPGTNKTNPLYVNVVNQAPGGGLGSGGSGGLGNGGSSPGSIFGDPGGGDSNGTGFNPLAYGDQKTFLSDQLLPRFQNGLSFDGQGGDSGGGGFFSDLSNGADGGGGNDAIIPFFANGSPGSISGPAIVGEQGPELFIPSGSGNVIPNHKLSGAGSSGHTFNIDARGATDPAQTYAAIHRAIAEATPHIQAGAVALGKNIDRRAPSSSRR